MAVLSLPEMPDLPDSVFVEDTALVLDECAVILRPGAASRRAETESVEKVLAPYRKLLHIQAPAHVDGGDILTLGRDLYVGLSARSEAGAIAQLGDLLQPAGYAVHAVVVNGCLHLKSAVTQIRQDAVLVNPAWLDKRSFHGVKTVEIDPSEGYAANAVLVGETLIYPNAFPRTEARLAAEGIGVLTVPADELAKAEGAVTCCSLLFQV